MRNGKIRRGTLLMGLAATMTVGFVRRQNVRQLRTTACIDGYCDQRHVLPATNRHV
jgi:hypothetical protein